MVPHYPNDQTNNTCVSQVFVIVVVILHPGGLPARRHSVYRLELLHLTADRVAWQMIGTADDWTEGSG